MTECKMHISTHSWSVEAFCISWRGESQNSGNREARPSSSPRGQSSAKQRPHSRCQSRSLARPVLVLVTPHSQFQGHLKVMRLHTHPPPPTTCTPAGSVSERKLLKHALCRRAFAVLCSVHGPHLPLPPEAPGIGKINVTIIFDYSPIASQGTISTCN